MMEIPVFLRFALRSLLRHKMRTALSVIGVAIGCSLSLAEISLTRAESELFLRNVAESGIGHFRIVPKDFGEIHDPSLRVDNYERELQLARRNPDVKVATPRTRIQGMLAMGSKTVTTEIIGIDPITEPLSNRYVRSISNGKYLAPSDSQGIFIGKAIAARLSVDVGDPVVVTVVDNKGELQGEMFEIAGIVDLGNKDLEFGVCHILLGSMERLVGIKGAGEIAVLVNKPSVITSSMQAISTHSSQNNKLLSWIDAMPEIKFGLAIDNAMAIFLTFIIVFVAFVGIASSQLTAMLERQKEFAVLAALGMGTLRIIGLIISEALLLGTVAFFATLLLSGPLLYYYSIVGFQVFDSSQSISAVGTVIDPVYYMDFGPWYFGYAAFLSFISVFAAGIYPGILATRQDPLKALRVAQ